MSDIEIRIIRATTDISIGDKDKFIKEFDLIADIIWEKDPAIYKDAENFYFNSTTGLALALDDGVLVGYSIYKRLNPLGRKTLFSVSTTIRPAYQSRGLRSRFLQEIGRLERNTDMEEAIYLAVRTRNPINWHVFSRCCQVLVPDYRSGSIIDLDLVNLGYEACKEIYPHLTIERPSMIIRNAFDWLRYRVQPRHKNEEINRAFFEDLSPVDGIFAIGLAREDLFDH